jgi:hypothetical protein
LEFLVRLAHHARRGQWRPHDFPPEPGKQSCTEVLRCFRWNKNGLFINALQKPFFNPERIASFSPGLARFQEGLPWVAAFKCHNPERVEYQILMKQVQPFQGCDFHVFSPRVARSSQPWAESFNPIGIGKTQNAMPLSRSLRVDRLGAHLSF